jgi:hypothetical protein
MRSTEPADRAIDETRCPICGRDNQCGIAAGAATCWCMSTPVPQSVIDRIPLDARQRACVCRSCATIFVAQHGDRA